MRRVLHISDLHFGRDRPELLDPLLEAIEAAEPDLVAVSGDLTQRARRRQFRQARAFLDRIGPPCLVVPGNHDVPLENLAARVFRPWSRYRRLVGPDLEPSWRDGEIEAIGLNTVNPFDWQRGRIGRRAVERVCTAFAREPERARTRIVVVHHPFEHRPTDSKALMRGARRALGALARCGADIVLSGHLHSWRAGPSAETAAGVLSVQAGTGLSTRLRGEENDFNLLTLEPGEAVVERFAATPDAAGFARVARHRFRQGARGWRAVETVDG